LQPLPSVGIGSFRLTLPSFGEVRGLPAQDSSGRSKTNVAKATVQHPAVGKLLGDFSLRDTEGKVMRPANFLGRPTLFTFSATWAPTTNEQLQTLARLQPNKDINIMPVAVQEGTAKVRAYTAITNIQLRWLVDPDSTLSNNYGAPNMPTHYFVDRKGVVREVASGILTEKQILNGLGSL
jgi:peroxiredoxin